MVRASMTPYQSNIARPSETDVDGGHTERQRAKDRQYDQHEHDKPVTDLPAVTLRESPLDARAGSGRVPSSVHPDGDAARVVVGLAKSINDVSNDLFGRVLKNRGVVAGREPIADAVGVQDHDVAGLKL